MNYHNWTLWPFSCVNRVTISLANVLWVLFSKLLTLRLTCEFIPWFVEINQTSQSSSGLHYLWVNLGVKHLVSKSLCFLNRVRKTSLYLRDDSVVASILNRYFRSVLHIVMDHPRSVKWISEIDARSKYSRQQNYSSTCDNTWDFSLVLLPNYIISCLL